MNVKHHNLTTNQLILLLQYHRGRRTSDIASDPATVGEDGRILQLKGLLHDPLDLSKSAIDPVTPLGTDFVNYLLGQPVGINPGMREAVFADLRGRLLQNDDDANELLSELISIADSLSPPKAAPESTPAKQTPGLFVSGADIIVLDHVVAAGDHGGSIALYGGHTMAIALTDTEAFLDALRKHQSLKHTHAVFVDPAKENIYVQQAEAMGLKRYPSAGDEKVIIQTLRRHSDESIKPRPGMIEAANEEANRQRARANHLEGILNDVLARVDLAKMRMQLPQGDASAGQG